jgi:hypothetical protein
VINTKVVRRIQLVLRLVAAVRPAGMAVLAVYVSACVFSPFGSALFHGTAIDAELPISCSCPMCAVDEYGIHHCSCCDHGKECECGISPRGDDEDTAIFLEMGLLSRPKCFLPTLVSRPLSSLNPLPFSDLQPNVPTPPPKS